MGWDYDPRGDLRAWHRRLRQEFAAQRARERLAHRTRPPDDINLTPTVEAEPSATPAEVADVVRATHRHSRRGRLAGWPREAMLTEMARVRAARWPPSVPAE